MYVSAKINKNCDLLYKYLIHRIYGLKFKTPALVVEKDAVFMWVTSVCLRMHYYVRMNSIYRPSGWDNEKKIAILYENIQSFSPDDCYIDIIRVHHNQNVFSFLLSL